MKIDIFSLVNREFMAEFILCVCIECMVHWNVGEVLAFVCVFLCFKEIKAQRSTCLLPM